MRKTKTSHKRITPEPNPAPITYECTYPGCRHAAEITEHSATPRHRHGAANVEMRKQINIGSMFYNINPRELKASGGEAAFGD